jgi:hypothetical protein
LDLDTHEFNKALVAKLAWMVASKSENLCIRVLRSKYRVRENWLRKESSKNGSTIWKAIEKEKP